MSTSDPSSLSSPPVSLPKPKKYDVQEYVSFVTQLAKVDAYLVSPELNNHASVFAVEDEATYLAHQANQTYFPTELVPADPLPVSAKIGDIELDSWSEILDSTAGPFSTDITAADSRFRDDAAQDATHMVDIGVSVFFSHLFFTTLGAGRLSLRVYLDRIYPYAVPALRADRAAFIRSTIISFHELERSTLASRITVDGVDYQALPAAGPPDRRSQYFGEPMNFLALGHTVQTRAAVRDYFDTITRVATC